MSGVRRLLTLGLAWLAVFLGFALAVGLERFASADNFQTILRQATIVGIGAIGATFVVIRGGIDLSVGSTVALVGVVVALAVRSAVDPWVAAALGLCAGAAVGALNGGIVRYLRVSPFIATLATLLAIRGIAKGLAGEQKVDAPLTMLRFLMAKLTPERTWQLVPPGVWLMLASAVFAAWVLRRTVFGRNLIAEGSNDEAARLAGLPIQRDLVIAYVIGGACAGLAGLAQFSRLTVGDPTVAVGLELDVIAAVVIGGASLNGGQGSVVGSLLGALMMATIRAGCSQYGLPNWVQEILTGAIILAAVASDSWRQRQDRS